jgi:hypothetical protein
MPRTRERTLKIPATPARRVDALASQVGKAYKENAESARSRHAINATTLEHLPASRVVVYVHSHQAHTIDVVQPKRLTRSRTHATQHSANRAPARERRVRRANNNRVALCVALPLGRPSKLVGHRPRQGAAYVQSMDEWRVGSPPRPSREGEPTQLRRAQGHAGRQRRDCKAGNVAALHPVAAVALDKPC